MLCIISLTLNFLSRSFSATVKTKKKIKATGKI